MNHTKNLQRYAETLVLNYATYNGETYNLSLADLPDDEQGELARLLLESTDRELTECVYGRDFAIDNDYTCALLKLLQDDTQENREHFATVTRSNVIAYYQQSLQEILNEACTNHLHEVHEEHGFHPQRRADNGELYWSAY